MPFTPFHMGPGTASKAVAGRYFSLTVFGYTQIVMDIEPLLRMLRADAVLHGFTHTYSGALLIAVFCVYTGKFCTQVLKRIWNFLTNIGWLTCLQIQSTISWTVAISGAFIGTFSHVFLDSFMHADMQPWAPFSATNSLLHLIPVGWLYLLCVILGVISMMLISIIAIWNKWSIPID